jgi:hypothetical protein
MSYFLSPTNNGQAGSGVSGLEAPLSVYFTNTTGTLTLPAVVGQFHFIRSITIVQYATAAFTAAGTPVLVTTTNLPGNPSIPMNTSGIALGDIRTFQLNPGDLKSSVVGTATTFVFSAIAGCTYYAIVTYFAGT